MIIREALLSLRHVWSLVQRAVKGKHKVLLFSQFTSMLDLIRERLAEQNTKYYCLTGNTDKQERQRLVDAFQNDDTPVFLISLKAGGTGIKLNGGRYCNSLRSVVECGSTESGN